MKQRLIQAFDSAKQPQAKYHRPTHHASGRLPAGMPPHLHSLILLVFAIRERWKQDPSTTRLAFSLLSIPYIRIRTKMITERNRRDRWNERAGEHEGNGIGPDRQTMPRLRHFAAMRRRRRKASKMCFCAKPADRLAGLLEGHSYCAPSGGMPRERSEESRKNKNAAANSLMFHLELNMSRDNYF